MGKEKLFVIAVIFLVVTLVVIFSFLAGSSEELKSAGDSITEANNCSTGTDSTGTALTYNATDRFCYNSSANNNSLYLAGQYDLPLNTLFSSTGVVLLVLMAAILITLIILALKFYKKQ